MKNVNPLKEVSRMSVSRRKVLGTTLATAAAALFISGAALTMAPSVAEAAQVKCVGANACKGQGACKTAKNDCKGLNACKGQGFVMTDSKADCKSMGGHAEG